MASSYNINNLYPKPGIFNNTPLTASALTVTSSPGQLDAAFFSQNDQFTLVYLTVNNHPVYVTFDDSTPSSSNGHYWDAKTEHWLSRAAAKSAKFVHSGADAVIFASPFEV